MQGNRPQHGKQRDGFALVITVSLLMLLTLLALGMLSLSAMVLRARGGETARAVAEANARMALTMAIGELQRTAGPDTRVTARADVMDVESPPILGVWKSWEGTDHDAQGRPQPPAYAAKKPKGAGSRFLTWLASPNAGVDPTEQTVPSTAASADSVTLLGEGSLGTDPAARKQEIRLAPTYVSRQNLRTGALAWWVCGENQKARLPQPYAVSGKEQSSSAMKSHAVADPIPLLGKDSLLNDPQPAARAVSLRETDFLEQSGGEKASRTRFFDLSTVSTGLLTNTATGGWRKDLSLFTENYDKVPDTGLPLFRLTPQKDSSQAKATSSQPTAPGSLLYPWSEYRGSSSSPQMPYDLGGACASWANLTDHALQYRTFGGSAPYRSASTPFTRLGDTFQYLHTVKRIPLVARIQWVYAYAMTQAPNNQQRVTVKLTPVVTLWNPYNITLDVGPLVFTVSKQSTMPVSLEYEVEYSDGVVVKGEGSIDGFRSLTGNGRYTPSVSSGIQPQFYINAAGSIPPGGTKVFSITENNPNTLISQSLEAGEGFDPNNGHFIQISDVSGTQIYSPRVKGGADRAVRVRTKARLDNSIATGVLAGKFGLRLVVREDGGGQGKTRIDGSNGNEMIYQMTAPPSSAGGEDIILPEISVANITAANGYPFMSLIFGLRLLDNLNVPGDPHDKNRLAKGFVQTNPAATVSDLTAGSAGSGRVNAAYDFNLVVHSANDDTVPNRTAGDNKGFLITGLTAGTGITRFVTTDLPLQPLASLAELQGWDLRFGNPAPPFACNLIGNSDASPLIPRNAAYLGGSSAAANLQHDDSYCANHLLFDDWFLSSISGGSPDRFGGSANQMKSNYSGFLTGARPLANHAYHPLAADSAAATRDASSVNGMFDQYVNQPDSWKTIASRLEVEGMFNVNSVSITAWRALLGHARGRMVPYYDGKGDVALASKTDHPVTRSAISGDIQADADSQGVAADGRANTSQYTGYRILTDARIEELAKNIVDQIRKRGPFLSLSEFINRQLSDENNLALAGTLQTALQQMESSIETGMDALPANGDPKTSDYRYTEAANGSSAFGLPGWIRQADVLRPIAPVLSARDDTFLVRAYGDARDTTGKITARATCEAVVRRTRDYVDPSEAADRADPPALDVNQSFGRRFAIVSFRWLSPGEI